MGYNLIIDVGSFFLPFSAPFWHTAISNKTCCKHDLYNDEFQLHFVWWWEELTVTLDIFMWLLLDSDWLMQSLVSLMESDGLYNEKFTTLEKSPLHMHCISLFWYHTWIPSGDSQRLKEYIFLTYIPLHDLNWFPTLKEVQ